jgi:chromosome segregation ATPase
MDVGALKEALGELNDLLPQLPDRVKAVLDEGDALREAGEGLLEDIREQQGHAQELLDGALASLGDLKQDAAQQEAAIQAAWSEVDGEVQALSGLEAPLQAVQQAGQAARAAMATLAQRLDAETAEVKAAHDKLKAAQDDLQAMAESAEGALANLAGDVTAAAQQLQGALQAAQAEVATHVQALASGAQSAGEAVLGALQEAVGDLLPSADTQVRGGIDAFKSSLETEVQSLIASWKQRVEQELQTGIDSAVSELTAALEVLQEGTRAAAGEWDGATAPLESVFTALGDNVPPLEGGVEQVKVAAQDVGLSWTA